MKKGEIRNVKKEVLSDDWYTLNKCTFEYQKEDGSWEIQHREVYDCGDAAAVLLFDSERRTVVLTGQFRMPTYLNGNQNGMMVEVPAGLLEGLDPEASIKKEIIEETGYSVPEVLKVMDAYVCPGAVAQKVHFFIARYKASMKVSDGGGAEDETENIEVLEYTFEDALNMIATGEIKDAKTILLLQYAQIRGLFD